MPKIIQHPVPDCVKPYFRAAGIKIKKYATATAFENDLKKFLARNHVLHLGTCRGRAPRVTPLEYRLNGLAFFVLSEGGGKFANLKENKRISFGIAEPYDSQADFFSNKGVQAWGTAAVYSLRNEPAKFRTALAMMNEAKGCRKIEIKNLLPQFHYRIIKITPDKIKYGNPREGVFQVTWVKK
ncbi:MAG: pyridoxamine 5'-phosphate oxidase family protein [Deltaproteobacteria bacterium]|nr:pyridoxamine 5'-phosphate oxidase family protein [Deltaproteobacteria bacterium]